MSAAHHGSTPIDRSAQAGFAALKFRHAWRPYQRRVLDAVDAHLTDSKLHVVAAPGAGKTTLGLEIVRRLGRPALVLSPTRVIRDQWLSRLGDFLDGGDIDSLAWVSRQLDRPALLTSVTYQALHTRAREDAATEDDDAEAEPGAPDDDEIADLVDLLRRGSVQVLVLDEAHHLRAEWWRALDRLCEALPDLVLVSLTATPPYDVVGPEWTRYEQLCGPIDEEISVPELVKAGTLCPHQDFVWAVDVTPSERDRLREYDERVRAVCQELFDSPGFNGIVTSHPWLQAAPAAADVLKEPRIAIALLTFLKARGVALPAALLALLDVRPDDVPAPGRFWWQVLVSAVLFSPTFEHTADAREYVARLRRQLASYDLLRRRELALEKSRQIDRSLALSVGKIKACLDIHALEVATRGESLRQVILTDFIRDEVLWAESETVAPNLGAWPVFDALRTSSPIPEAIGLLTGRISLVPAIAADELLSAGRGLQGTSGPSVPGYVAVAGPLNELTAAFTQLLVSGRLRVLVGTRALLGEGWDAPAVNSLVLASVAGSFMLTNQMRGRAIRIDRSTPDKVSSLWHLVAVDHGTTSGLNDLRHLRQRFQTFVGLSETGPAIESEFDRLGAAELAAVEQAPTSSGSSLRANNARMARRLKALPDIKRRWDEALVLGGAGRVLPTVTTAPVASVRAYHLRDTLQYLLLQITTTGLTIIGLFTAHAEDWPALLVLGSIGTLVASVYLLPKLVRAARILLRHLPVDGSVKQIAVALAEALSETGFLKTPARERSVMVTVGPDGDIRVALAGGTFYESSLFADCLAEMLGPIDNPRYLVVRSGKLFGLARDDYHAVPLLLGARKELAQAFHEAWLRHVGPSELIYTRDEAGRATLLRARTRAFSAAFAAEARRQDRWVPKT